MTWVPRTLSQICLYHSKRQNLTVPFLTFCCFLILLVLLSQECPCRYKLSRLMLQLMISPLLELPLHSRMF